MEQGLQGDMQTGDGYNVAGEINLESKLACFFVRGLIHGIGQKMISRTLYQFQVVSARIGVPENVLNAHHIELFSKIQHQNTANPKQIQPWLCYWFVYK